MHTSTKTVSWFSAGVSSAVATKLAIDDVDEIYFIDIEDQHEDTKRFVDECESWFGKQVRRMMSPYKTVEAACLSSGGWGYINGPAGAACTKFLKRRVRREWEIEQKEKLTYIWGFDANEKHRAERVESGMREQSHRFPLIELGISKDEAHKILKSSGIKRPAMYDLGYNNNNCVGCVKGGKGYWNQIRKDFPDVFNKRAKMERLVLATCIKGVYLDELDPEEGRGLKPIVDDCGIFCELMSL